MVSMAVWMRAGLSSVLKGSSMQILPQSVLRPVTVNIRGENTRVKAIVVRKVSQ